MRTTTAVTTALTCLPTGGTVPVGRCTARTGWSGWFGWSDGSGGDR